MISHQPWLLLVIVSHISTLVVIHLLRYLRKRILVKLLLLLLIVVQMLRTHHIFILDVHRRYLMLESLLLRNLHLIFIHFLGHKSWLVMLLLLQLMLLVESYLLRCWWRMLIFLLSFLWWLLAWSMVSLIICCLYVLTTALYIDTYW